MIKVDSLRDAPGTSKFSRVVDEAMYQLTLEDGADLELSAEHLGGWHGFIVDPWILTGEAEKLVNGRELSFLHEQCAAIIEQTSDGFVYARYFTDRAKAKHVWAAIEKLYEVEDEK